MELIKKSSEALQALRKIWSWNSDWYWLFGFWHVDQS